MSYRCGGMCDRDPGRARLLPSRQIVVPKSARREPRRPRTVEYHKANGDCPLSLSRGGYSNETTALRRAGRKDPAPRFRRRLYGRLEEQEARPGRTERKHRGARRLGLPALRREPPLAAAGAPGHGFGRQGRHDPPRHAGLQSAKLPGHGLQAAGRHRAGPRLPLADRRRRPAEGLYRHLQPLALRGRAGGPRPQPRARRKNGRAATIGSTSSRRLLHEGGTTIVKVFLHISKKSSAGGCKRGWTIRRNAGNSAGPTSRSGITGTRTRRPTRRR